MGPATNLFGIDVSGLDVPAFLVIARTLYPPIALAGLFLVLRLKRPTALLVLLLAASLHVWFVTNYPLQRLYALGVGNDRLNNLAFSMVVAAGNSPIETWQVGQTHFDPSLRPHNVLWGLLVAILSGWNVERALLIYPILPLLMASGFLLALYAALGPPTVTGAWSPWERALVGGFAVLLSSAPFDFLAAYKVPWAMTFQLKPNHALGLVLFPFLLKAMAGIRTWRGAVAVGLLLNLLGWAFLLHMAFAAVGLWVFAALAMLERRPGWRTDVRDVLIPLGLNALIASPYLLRLLLMQGSLAMGASREGTLAGFSPHLLEITFRFGGVFWLGLWGGIVAYRREDRLGRLLAAQLAAAFLIWGAYRLLSELRLAEQPDEIFYWARFLTAAMAGVGAWDLAGRAFSKLRGAMAGPAPRAALILLIALPWTLPYWWDPARMDSYFEKSLTPLHRGLGDAARYLLDHTGPHEVLAGDEPLSRWTAALAGRRSLLTVAIPAPRDQTRRFQVIETLILSHDAEAVRRAAASYGITHVIVTPTLLDRYGVSLGVFQARPFLRQVFFSDQVPKGFLAIFRIIPGQPAQ